MSDIFSQIRSQGFTHVLTYGGPVALDDWEPYGKSPDAIPFFLDGDTLREREDSARPRPSGPVVTGLWRLLRTPAALVLGAFLALGASDVYDAEGELATTLHLPSDARMADAFPASKGDPK